MIPKSNHPTNKNENSLKEHAMPPLPFEKHIKKKEEKKAVPRSAGAEDSKKKDIAAIVKEALGILGYVEEMQADIEKKLEEIFEKMGWSPRFLAEYLRNSANFSQAELKYIRDDRTSMIKSLKLPPNLENELEKSFVMDKPVETQKKRRSKSAGSRRQWIPVK